MKIRSGFVSNSSSSSFVCNICGRIESGWDASLSDFDMVGCLEGHTICKDHLNESTFNESFEKCVKEELEESIKEYPEIDPSSLEDDIRSEFENELPENVCPICNLSIIQNDDLVNYAISDDKKSEIENEIRSKYKNYKEFKKGLKDKKNENKK